MKKFLSKKTVFLLGGVFVFALFLYISICTPLAGDDWGYYLNGAKGHPIATTINFYYSWSGRFFSELWGMIMPLNKWLWNIVNPLLFMAIFFLVNKIAGIKNKVVTSSLIVIFLMLTVEEGVRMETYTWIMGTTYVVPLCLSLLYFYSIDLAFKEDKINKPVLLLNNICLIISCLMMENIAGTIVGAIFIVGVYAFFKNKKLTKYLAINFVVALASFMIMRLSPGSAYRAANDHVVWGNMSFVGKIVSAYPNFLSMTFINNRYLIVVLSAVMAGLILFCKKKNKVLSIFSLIIYGLSIVSMLSYYINSSSILINPNSIYSFIFWPIYVLILIVDLFYYLNNDYQRDKIILLFVIGGTSALIMLYSPIYGPRSAIYTIYYLIAVIIAVFDTYELPYKFMSKLLVIGLLGFICLRSYSYINKYQMARNAQEERLSIIEYYKDHPEEEEAWIPRFPINIIHSIDVEEGDTYHFETFKDYYKLPQEATKIFFYWKEQY